MKGKLLAILIGLALMATSLFSQVVFNPATATPSDILRGMAVQQLLNHGDMSLGEYYSLSPESRAMIPPDVTHRIFQQAAARAAAREDIENQRQQAALAARAAQAAAFDAWTKSPEHRALLLKMNIAFQRENAANGDPEAQYGLAMHYLNGDGVKKNRAIALLWLRAAGSRGSTKATQMLDTLTNAPRVNTNPSPAR